MQRYPMTISGEQSLIKELENLKSVLRPAIIADIAEARAHGDLKENAEYHAAREEQGFIEARIKDIEAKLSNSQVIDVENLALNGKIVFGTTVSLVNINTEESITYKIVGDDEADVENNKISINSPIARAMISKEEGDEISVKTPSGIVEYEIEKVEYIN